MSRKDAAVQVLKAMKTRRFTFHHIAKAVGQDVLWVNAALLGDTPLAAREAATLADILDLGPEVADAFQQTY